MIVTATIVADNYDPWFPLMLESTKWVDRRIFVVDRPDKRVWDCLDALTNCDIIHRKYDHASKNADGKQRNNYLKHLKDRYYNDWCLVIDTDEVLCDNGNHLRFYADNTQQRVFNIRMHHFFYHLGVEDSSSSIHWVPRRFFKVQGDLYYQEVEHPLLRGGGDVVSIKDIVLFHYGATRGLMFELDKWRKQCVKSNIHTSDDLEKWKNWHLYGTIPLKAFPIHKHPQPVRKHFDIKRI